MKKSSNGRLEKTVQELAEGLKVLREGQNTLQQSQNSLLQAQAHLVEAQARRDKEMAELGHRTDERIAEIRTILLRLLDVLPEAVRDKIGIQPEKQP